MFNLRVVQAAFGDCLILEYGTKTAPRYILIDGGTRAVYEKYLKRELEKIAGNGKKLKAVIVSHVDTDHIVGLLAFTSELLASADRFISFDRLWHNSFARAIDRSGDIQRKMESLGSGSLQAMDAGSAALFGVKEGNKLRVNAKLLDVPINPGFEDDLVSVGTAPSEIEFGNLTLKIVGPTRANLENLEEEWRAWLEKNEDVLTEADPLTLSKLDTTVPNLSSIMVLARAHGKTMLLTGDGRGDHLIDGLREAKLLKKGKLHVDLLKLPHHGSDANVTRDFFDTVTADIYVASANGRYGNPDLATLIWIVEAAKEQGRRIRIFATNETPATKALERDYKPTKYGYKLHVMDEAATAEVIKLA